MPQQCILHLNILASAWGLSNAHRARAGVSVLIVGRKFGLRWPLGASLPIFHRRSAVMAMEGPVRLEGMTEEQVAEAKRELDEAASRGAAAGYSLWREPQVRIPINPTAPAGRHGFGTGLWAQRSPTAMSPLWGSCMVLVRGPVAHATGFILPPLRGWSTGTYRLRIGRQDGGRQSTQRRRHALGQRWSRRSLPPPRRLPE